MRECDYPISIQLGGNADRKTIKVNLIKIGK